MYLSHYGFKKRPFSLSPNPEFLWLGEKHLEALSVLKYGILEDKSFLLLTGDIGTGKTALINYLVNKINDKMIVATIPNPNLELMDFYNVLADEFQMNRKYTSKGDFLIQFEKFLLEAHYRKTRVLIIIDEAQKINSTLLDEIRVLSNIELPERKLLGIFFVGQSEFNDLVRKERNKPLRQRITIRHHILPLSETETESYINHRIRVAGAKDALFNRDAIRQIFNYSSGYPRLINIICDHALLTGYVRGAKVIEKDVIEECQRELGLQNLQQQDNENAAAKKSPPPSGKRKKSNSVLFGGVFFLIVLLGYVLFSVYNKQVDRAPIVSRKLIEQQHRRPDSPVAITNSGSDKLEEKQTASAVPTGETASITINGADKHNEIAAETEISKITGRKTKADEKPLSAKTLPSGIESSDKQEVPSKIKADFRDDKPKTELLKEFSKKKIVVHFKYKSDELTQQALDMLEPLIQMAAKRTDANLVLQGYTDSSGSYAYNLTLSKIRANIVKSYLVDQGVPAERIVSIGNGPENPIASNETVEGRAMNRRVEITVKLNE